MSSVSRQVEKFSSFSTCYPMSIIPHAIQDFAVLQHLSCGIHDNETRYEFKDKLPRDSKGVHVEHGGENEV